MSAKNTRVSIRGCDLCSEMCIKISDPKVNPVTCRSVLHSHRSNVLFYLEATVSTGGGRKVGVCECFFMI